MFVCACGRVVCHSDCVYVLVYAVCLYECLHVYACVYILVTVSVFLCRIKYIQVVDGPKTSVRHNINIHTMLKIYTVDVKRYT